MASCPAVFEEYLLCPVCRDIFKDPVLLMCSHSFCKMCLQLYWQHIESPTCPLCRTSSSVGQAPCNLTLKNLCEAFMQEKHYRAPGEFKVLCELHMKKVTHYCLEDQQPVCEECQTSEIHSNHSFRELDEAASDLKLELKRKLADLSDKLKLFRNLKVTCMQTDEFIKVQANHTEALIRGHFEKLHQFLWDEEMNRVAALREEEKQKNQTVIENLNEVNKNILSLSEKVQKLEDEVEASNISFLQNYKDTVKRCQYEQKEPENFSDSLINVAAHVGNLQFKVWQKMQNVIQYTPVIFDPNTAHPYLHLSADLTEVKLCNDDPELPFNPERFTNYTSILGSEGFKSGTHCWDIDVGDSTAWAVGVISESVYRNREKRSKMGLWHVGYYRGKYGQGLSDEMLMPLRLKEKLQRIRVILDWDEGRISFLDAVSNSKVHTFEDTFSERLYPYFCNACSGKTLSIIPVKISLTEE